MLNTYTDLPDLQDVLEDLHGEVFPAPPPPPQNSHLDNHSVNSSLTDGEVHTKASWAANSAYYLDLYSGGLAGKPSPSEGDSALACMYLFWTGGDVIQTERLLRASPRAQIDPKKRQRRADYWPRTVQNALSVVREFYQGGQGGPAGDFDEEADMQPIDVAEGEADAEVISEVVKLRQENRRLRLEKRVLCNSYIRQEAPTYLAILSLVAGGCATGVADARGYVHINYDRLAKSVLGRKSLNRLPNDQRERVLKKLKDKITRHVKRGAELGLLDKRNEDVWLTKDRKISRTYFRLHGDLAEHLELLVDFVPGEAEARNWGGVRPCKECGSTAVVRKEYCADCGCLRRDIEIDADGIKTTHFDQEKGSKIKQFPHPQDGDSVGQIRA